MNPSKKALLEVVFVMVVWGSASSVTKVAVSEVPPFTLALLRFSIALVTLLVIRLFTKPVNNLPLPWLPVTLMGISGVTAFYIFFNLSLLHTSASDGSLIQGFIPVGIAIFAVIFLKEKLSFLQVMGILLSLGGILIIGLLGDQGADKSSTLKGNLYMVISAMTWAVYTVISKKVAAVDPLRVTIGVAVTGVLFLIPFAVVEDWHTGWPSIGWKTWLGIIYLGSIASALAYLLYNKAMDTMGAAQIGNFLNLDPIIGFLIALIFLKEQVNIWQIVGGVLVVGGIFLSSGKKSH